MRCDATYRVDTNTGRVLPLKLADNVLLIPVGIHELRGHRGGPMRLILDAKECISQAGFLPHLPGMVDGPPIIRGELCVILYPQGR
jgi:hypothetical protein